MHKLQGIQAVRAFAALAVIVYHAINKAWPIAELPERWLALNLGSVAVLLFFTVSGYVIAFQRSERPGRFLARRMLRIYPAYLVAMLFGTAAMVAFGLTSAAKIPFDVSLLLIPGGRTTGFSGIPYWTLVYEVYFYAVALLLMLLGPKLYEIGLIVWAAAVLICLPYFQYPVVAQLGFDVAYSPYNLFFIGGMALSLAQRGRPVPLLVIAAMTGLLVYLSMLHDILWMINLVILCLAVVGLAGMVPEMRSLRPAARLGDWSYGIYLMHFVPIAAVGAMEISDSAPVRLAAMLAASIFVGILYGMAEFSIYETVLKPIADRLSARRRVDRAVPEPAE